MTSKQDGYEPQSRMVFTGEHHAIWEFACKLGTSGINTTPYVLLTIQYLFTDGADHFQHIVTFNSSHIDDPGSVQGLLGSDSRSPYGSLNWDGDNGGITMKSGLGEGMWHIVKGNLDNMTWQNLTYGSGGYMLCPYVEHWRTNDGYDDEIGYIQTRLQTKHRGGHGRGSCNSSPSGTISGTDVFDVQFSEYQGWWGERTCWQAAGPTGAGQIGVSAGYENYSLTVLIGRKSDAGVQRLVDEANAVMNAATALDASVGSVRTAGIESAGMQILREWDKPGFDQVYRTWALAAENNRAAATLTVRTGETLVNPTFVVGGYTSAQKPTVRKDGAALTEGAGYYCSVIPGRQEAWVTYLSDFSGAVTVDIEGPADAVGIDIAGFADRQVTFTATVTDNGTIAAVTLDLSAVGGTASVAMSGSGDSYTCTHTIPAGTVGGGPMMVTLTAEDNEGNTKSAVTSVLIKKPDLVLYLDAIDRVSEGWAPNGSMTKTSADNPYEGGEHLKIDYSRTNDIITTIAFDQVYDVSTYSYLVVAVRGPETGRTFEVELRATGNWGSGYEPVGQYDSYQLVAVPLGSFSISLTAIEGLRVQVGAAGSGSGTFYLDAIYFTTIPPEGNEPPVAASPPSAGTRSSMGLTIRPITRGAYIATHAPAVLSVYVPDGRLVSRQRLMSHGGYKASLPAAGIYLIETRSVGAVARQRIVVP
jgi:hypothetical protein